jgi:hypothetical protein
MDPRGMAALTFLAVAAALQSPASAADEAVVTSSPGSSDAEIVEVPLDQPEDAECTAEQTAGKADPPRCTLVVVDGEWLLRIEGFELSCDVHCAGESSLGIVELTSEQNWSFSR